MNLLEDIPTLKQIKRNNLPLEEMREPRTVLCNIYKRNNGIANRETYANLVLHKRRDYIRANTLVMRFLDEWHKNAKRALKGYTHFIEELEELIDKASFSIPTSDISEFGYVFSNNPFFYIDKTMKKKEYDDIYHSVDKYFSDLRIFYYQFPKAIANEDNFKNTASANLFDIIMLLPSFQSNFMNAFGKYISTAELEQIHEKENRSIKCLWVVWESLRDGFDYNSVSHLLQRYDQMKTTLVGKFVDAIKIEWKSCGFDSERLHIDVNQKTVEIVYIFSTEEEYYGCFYCIQVAIAKKLANYNYFSSQRMVLQNLIEKVIIKPLYRLRDGSLESLDGQHFVCNMESLFIKADGVVKNEDSFLFVPEPNENNIRITELVFFNQLIAVMNLIILTSNKLSSLCEQFVEYDVTAKEIVDNYRHLCEKRMIETDVAIFDSLSTFGLQDASVKKKIDNAIEVTKSFLSSIVYDSTWFMDSDQLKNAFNKLNDIKLYAQMQLLSSKFRIEN